MQAVHEDDAIMPIGELEGNLHKSCSQARPGGIIAAFFQHFVLTLSKHSNIMLARVVGK